KKYIHVNRLFYNEQGEKLARLIMKNSFAKMVYFVNTGAEATEVAVKLARKWGVLNKNGAYKVITFENSFHGRTIAALTATAQKKFHKYIKPLAPGFVYAKFNDIDSVRKKMDAKTAAVLIEPIQAEGGVNVAGALFMKKLAALCAAKKVLLMVDEVQTGLGRTGKTFAYMSYGIKPDVMTLGKGLGGGLPLSAVAVSGKLKDVFGVGDHGTTMGGNPVACAAGIEVMKRVTSKTMLKSVAEKGEYLKEKLLGLESPKIREVRGEGLLIGLELTEEAAPYVEKALKKGLILNSPKPKVIRLVPPLTITKNEIDCAVRIIAEILG
ncbi:MAG TPA: aminotransferase class III-fold pyridoxal phosphate-dependent enzyme, partial [Candidatus Goldiibacteriota bacterium]|nr:aminotransferase class III-fold pyridoxal phosphate-dependent enzyme [Candidatus Goldiibacteriota bacterium]